MENHKLGSWVYGLVTLIGLAFVYLNGVSAQTVPPATPSNLHTTSVTSSLVVLAWTDNATTEDKFNVEREVAGSASWVFLSQPGANTTTYTDTSLAATITYNYRVQACLSGTGCSDYTYVMGITLSSGSTGGSTPAAPSTVSASAAGSNVVLTWSTVSTATHYNTYRSAYPSAGSWVGVCSTTGTSNTSCSDLSVASGIYYYRVEACQEGYGCSGAVNSQYAYSSSVTIGGSTTLCTGLTLLLNKTSYSKGEDVNYTWACTPAGAATSVTVQLLKPGGSVTTYNSFSGSASTMSLGFSTSNLEAGSHTLRACFTSDCSPVTVSAGFTVTVTTSSSTTVAPPTPGVPVGSASVAVGASTGCSAMLYDQMSGGSRLNLQMGARFDWGDGTTSDTALIYPELSGAISPSVLHSWATAGTYGVRVRARSSTLVESGWSSTLNVTVLSGTSGGGGGGSGGTPAAPGSLSATASGSNVNLSWSNVSNATHYNLYRSVYPVTGTWTSVCTSSQTSTSCSDSSLPSGTYQYRIEACTSGYGCSGVVNNQWAYSGPTSVGAVSNTCTSLTLTLNKTTYTVGENVNYTWACSPSGTATYVAVQLAKPDSNVITYNTYSGSGQSSLSLGFGTSNLVPGSYALRACVTSTCVPVTVSAPFTIVTTGSSGAPAAPGLPIGQTRLLVGQTGSVTATLYSSSSQALQAVFDWGDSTYLGSSAFVMATTAGVTSPSVGHAFSAAGTYHVRAKARSSAGLESGWSGEFIVNVTGSVGSQPEAPTNLHVDSATASGIYLVWVDKANNEDKFNVERKLTTATDWSAARVVQLPGANITTYTDTNIASSVTYDYRVQACLSGTGCSGYTYVIGVTGGSAAPAPTVQMVTVQIQNGTIVPAGFVAFVRDNFSTNASFNNASFVTMYLAAGTYDVKLSFPGVDSNQVSLSGSEVVDRRLTVGNTAVTILVGLPVRRSVRLMVASALGEPVVGARVMAGRTDNTAYTEAVTDGTSVAWLQLPPGTYKVMVTKLGFLPHTMSLVVGDISTQESVTLETLPLLVSGRVLVGTTPVRRATVQALNEASGAIVVVSTNEEGNYSLSLKAGKWHLFSIVDGYAQGDGGVIELAAGNFTRDLWLGSALALVSSSANIVPTASVTVTAAELGVTVGLPANALGSGTSATVTIRESSHTVATAAAQPLPGSVRDVTATSATGAVTSLASAASLEFTYTDADLTAAGANVGEVSNLKLAFWDTLQQDWQILDSIVDAPNHKVRAVANHFTLFAIVLPFVGTPAQAAATVPPEQPKLPAAGPALDERAEQFAKLVAEGTQVFTLTAEGVAQAASKVRNEELEHSTNARYVAKTFQALPVTMQERIVNFIAYGTVSTLRLGAGERAGVVASFSSAYAHAPQSEFDWQEVLKIANGRFPGRLNAAREAAVIPSFKQVYARALRAKDAHDSAAVAIMAYGLRTTKRNLAAERSALITFRYVFKHAPATAADWDIMRAIAYSGAVR